MNSFDIIRLLFTQVFLWMILGAIIASMPFWKSRWTLFVLKRIAVQIFLPILMAEKILGTLDFNDLYLVGGLSISAVFMVLGSLLLTKLWISKISLGDEMKGTLLFSNTFHNYGFIAYSLVFTLFGEKSLALVFIFASVTDAMLWSFGILILQKGQGLKVPWTSLLTIPFVTVVISFFLAGLGLPKVIPQSLYNIAQYPGSITIPLLLCCMGAVLVEAFKNWNYKLLFQKPILFSLLSRTLVIPCLWLGLIHLLIPKGYLQNILFIEAIMPASMGIVALVSIYGGNKAFTGAFSLISNLFSAVSIPIYLLWIL